MTIPGFPAPFSVRMGTAGITPDDCDVTAADGSLLLIDRREVCEAVARALNAHDDLVAALRDIIRTTDAFEGEPADDAESMAAIDRARAALAKAEGAAS